MSRKKVLMSASAAAVVASAFVATEDVSAASHKVAAGESLWMIAQANNVSVSDLKKWNNLQHDLIFPNQVIQVMKPVDKSSTKKSTSEVSNNKSVDEHIVKSGDTLSEIAFANKVSVKNLMELNNLNSTLIFPGNALLIPGKQKESDENIHTVVAGDTLSHLALKYGITAGTIADLNNMKLGDIIYVGDKLTLQDGKSAESTNSKSEAKPKVNTSSKTETKDEKKTEASAKVESKPKAEPAPKVDSNKTESEPATKSDESTESAATETTNTEQVANKDSKPKAEAASEKEEPKQEETAPEPEVKEEPKQEEATPEPEAKEEPKQEEATPEPEVEEEPKQEETAPEPEVEEEPKQEETAPKTEAKEDPKPEAKPDTNSNTYVVKSGDTLSKIATAHGITAQKIATISGINTNDTLNIGDKLKVKGTPVKDSKPETKPEPEAKPETKPEKETKPEAKPEPEPKPEPKPDANASTYVVKSGDTLAAIASAHGTTAQKIASNSGISTSTTLHIGDKLSVNGKANDNSNSNSSPVENTGNDNSKPKPEPTPKPPANAGFSANQLMSSANSVMGTKYVWGGTTQSGGFDCSGFIHWAYNDAGKEMPRTSTDGYYSRSYEISKSELQVGDLVFFSGTYRPGISHMGIYAGNNQFKHAATSTGVATTSLDNSYWSGHFDSFKRFY